MSQTLPESLHEFFHATDLTAMRQAALAAFAELKRGLNDGSIRAAQPGPQGWTTQAWVKEGILLGFRLGVLAAVGDAAPGAQPFFDKDTFPLRPLQLSDAVRVVPGGSSLRDGCFLAAGVICMPPSYVNVGAYVDEGTLIDSHVLVGSCAQIGRRVHLSAGVQVGGVLEPVNAAPVIIEDDVLVGGNCGIYEGTRVGSGAVIAAGTVLTRGTPVYDLVHETVHRAGSETPLCIPPHAVVVPGARAVSRGRGPEWGLSLYTPVIVKYRDDKTARSVELEDWLR